VSSISSQTHVFAFFHNNGGWSTGASRIWITAIGNRRDNRGNLVLFPTLDDDPAAAKAFTYETFVLMRRRFSEEIVSSLYHDLRGVLTPGDTAEEIDAGVSSHSAPDRNNRTIQSIKGLMVRPGYDARGAGWYVKIFGPDSAVLQVQSIRGDTAEEAAQMVVDRGLSHLAEKFPVPKPAPAADTKSQQPMLRPGDRWR